MHFYMLLFDKNHLISDHQAVSKSELVNSITSQYASSETLKNAAVAGWRIVRGIGKIRQTK